MLGGRFHDLDQFIRSEPVPLQSLLLCVRHGVRGTAVCRLVRANVPCKEAVERIVSKAEVHIRNTLFRPNSVVNEKQR
jgi:hypothetical protein